MSGDGLMGFSRFLVAVFLVSLSVLSFEVALSFEFAFMFWFYLSFIVIAVAMFGIGVGSVFGFFLLKNGRHPYNVLMHISALGLGGSMLLTLVTARFVSTNLSGFEITLRGLTLPVGAVLLIMGSAVVPFIFAGIFLSLALNYPSPARRRISFIYMADLVGAGIGAFLITGLLPFTGVEEVIAFSAIIAVSVSTLFIKRHRILSFTVAAVLIVGSVFVLFNGSFFRPLPLGGKFLSTATDSGAVVIDTVWTSVSRLDLLEYPEGGGRRFIENGEYPITVSRGTASSVQRTDPRWSMFYRKPRSMLAIGSGGGVEVAMALSEGVGRVQAVEINPAIVDYMEGDLAEYSQGLYLDPRVQTQIEDGRTFLHRTSDKYDLIENGVLGSAGLVVPSTAMLTTKDMNVYTVEANQEYIRHLTPDGVAVTIIYGLLDDFNVVDREQGVTAISLKQYSTVREALLREGLDWERHFAIFAFEQDAENFGKTRAQAEYTFIFRNALSQAEVEQLISETQRQGLKVLYAPYNRGSVDFEKLILGLDENRDVSPATDDRPFFYFTDRGLGNMLIAAIGFVLFITLVFIIAPIAVSERLDFDISKGFSLLFFLAIGVGYILVETTLIYRLVLFLGRPSYAFQIVIFSMLTFSGLGSMATGALLRRGEDLSKAMEKMLLAISLIVILYSFTFQSFVLKYIRLELPSKIALTFLALAPPAFIMGMPFPLGLRLISEKDPHKTIWMYGVNSSGAVIASILGMYMALLYGFSKTLLLGGVMYALAFISLSLYQRGLK